MIYWKLKKGWEMAPWHEVVEGFLDILKAYRVVNRLEFIEWFCKNRGDYLEKLEDD